MPDYDDSKLLGWLSMQLLLTMSDEDLPVDFGTVQHCELAGWIIGQRLTEGRRVDAVTLKGLQAIEESLTAIIAQKEAIT